MTNLEAILDHLGFRFDERYPNPVKKARLQQLKISSTRFSQLVEGEGSPMNIEEAKAISAWLGVSVQDLLNTDLTKVSLQIEVPVSTKDEHNVAA